MVEVWHLANISRTGSYNLLVGIFNSYTLLLYTHGDEEGRGRSQFELNPVLSVGHTDPPVSPIHKNLKKFRILYV